MAPRASSSSPTRRRWSRMRSARRPCRPLPRLRWCSRRSVQTHGLTATAVPRARRLSTPLPSHSVEPVQVLVSWVAVSVEIAAHALTANNAATSAPDIVAGTFGQKHGLGATFGCHQHLRPQRSGHWPEADADGRGFRDLESSDDGSHPWPEARARGPPRLRPGNRQRRRSRSGKRTDLRLARKPPAHRRSARRLPERCTNLPLRRWRRASPRPEPLRSDKRTGLSVTSFAAAVPSVIAPTLRSDARAQRSGSSHGIACRDHDDVRPEARADGCCRGHRQPGDDLAGSGPHPCARGGVLCHELPGDHGDDPWSEARACRRCHGDCRAGDRDARRCFGHALAVAALATGAPAATTATLGQTHGLAVAAAATGSPAVVAPTVVLVHAFSVAALATTAPNFGTATLGQKHGLCVANLATSSPATTAPTVVLVHAFSVAALATSQPATTAITLGQTHGLAVAALATASPAITAPSAQLVHALSVAAQATGAPAATTTTLGQTHGLSVANLATASPAFTAPGFAWGATHGLAAIAMATGSPATTATVLGQKHGLSVNAAASGSPSLGATTLGQVHGLTVAATASGSPATTSATLGQTHGLAVAALAVGAPSLTATTIGQKHGLTVAAAATGSPIFGTPAVGQRHDLIPQSLAAPSPALGSPLAGQKHILAPDSLSTPSPVLGQPDVRQTHVLTASSLVVAAPAIGIPQMGAGAPLSVAGFATSSPTFGAVTLGQKHGLAVASVAIAAPAVGSPVLVWGQVHALSVASFAVGSPVTTAPVLGQAHALLPVAVAPPPPVTTAPALGQRHALSGNALATGPPDSGAPVIGQRHALSVAHCHHGLPRCCAALLRQGARTRCHKPRRAVAGHHASGAGDPLRPCCTAPLRQVPRRLAFRTSPRPTALRPRRSFRRPPLPRRLSGRRTSSLRRMQSCPRLWWLRPTARQGHILQAVAPVFAAPEIGHPYAALGQPQGTRVYFYGHPALAVLSPGAPDIVVLPKGSPDWARITLTRHTPATMTGQPSGATLTGQPDIQGFEDAA